MVVYNSKVIQMIKYFCDKVPVETAAMQQLENVAVLPFIHHHVAVMPDVHVGRGATIGSVIPTVGAIIPAAVGVDIGCGMMARKLTLRADSLPDSLGFLRYYIEHHIPHGRTDNGGKLDTGARRNIEPILRNYPESIRLWNELEIIFQKNSELAKYWDCERAFRHLGTLGTGNHFIELCIDTDGNCWIMLHSGSRGIGNAIGNYFITRAKKDMERFFINLPDKDLSYIPEGSELFNNYIEALGWAQRFAALNRKVMMEEVHEIIRQTFGFSDASYTVTAINCHHNYVAQEYHYGKNVWVTRKGALRARKDDLGIIPGSMGAKSFIVRGLGNHESFHSCSHGAGRIMSRTEAKKLVSLEQHQADLAGVECRKDESVLDETPRAYKDIDAVMESQRDLVEIVYTLKQVLCVKG